jgi:hypothetical protein
MNPEAGSNHRFAVTVETRIVYKGKQGGQIEAIGRRTSARDFH